MRAKAIILTAGILLLSATIVLAQREKLIRIDGDGDFHLGTRTIVANHILEKGMYRVTVTHVNGGHRITFFKVPMNHFGKGMWPGARRELFRIEAMSEPGAEVKKTTLKVLRKDNVQLGLDLTFKGDPTRYVLPRATIAGL